MILSRARDALQTPADTRFQWKGQGKGLKNTHKSHFAFPRLPEVVKIKGMHGTPDRRHWRVMLFFSTLNAFGSSTKNAS